MKVIKEVSIKPLELKNFNIRDDKDTGWTETRLGNVGVKMSEFEDIAI